MPTTITGTDISTKEIDVDSGTLFVDSSNNRVGVGTSSPQEQLDVNGTIKGNGFLGVRHSQYLPPVVPSTSISTSTRMPGAPNSGSGPATFAVGWVAPANFASIVSFRFLFTTSGNGGSWEHSVFMRAASPFPLSGNDTATQVFTEPTMSNGRINQYTVTAFPPALAAQRIFNAVITSTQLDTGASVNFNGAIIEWTT